VGLGYSTGRRPWRSEAPRELADEMVAVKQKVFYLGAVVVLVFGVLTFQLARMQLVDGHKYQVRAENNRLRQVTVVPPRGLIYDRNGLPLVENRASFSAAVVAADVPLDRETSITLALQELTGVPAGEIAARIDERRHSNDPFTPSVFKSDLSEDTAYLLRERLADLPGVRVVVDSRREYPFGPLVSNVLGYVYSLDAEEYADLKDKGYLPSDRIGKTGVELTYESVLRGRPGTKVVETDASGREIGTVDELAAQPGNSLVLSIDLDLQRRVTEVLQQGMGQSANAAAVVVDVKSGEILALVSLPAYDNNVFTNPSDTKPIEQLLSDPGKPLVDHAIAEMYPPGSTFKQVTALAALQEGVANASTQITSLGSIQVKNQFNPNIVYTFKDWAALGTLNFYRGVAMSSDVYFYYLAGGYTDPNTGKEVFQGLGATRLSQWARKFGLGTPTGIDLPGESEGNIPDPDWKERTFGEPWTIGDTYNMGIGQGYVTATPVQMAMVTAAIANGGDVLVPHVVHALTGPDGNVVLPTQRKVKSNLNVDPRNIDILREGMREAVDGGTAATAAIKNVQLAGKTGTAEFGERHPDGSYDEHGWFSGFGPFNNPEIAVTVFLDRGNGALNAAPVASKIFDYYFNRRNLAGNR
jgi:penicillin-binding protein 2